MNIKRPLLPGFLKRAEQKLLLNKPGIWSARTHLVLYYGLLFMIVLTGICYLAPSNPTDRSDAGYWTGFVSIISIIAFTIWLIYLLRFNVFKKYGNIHPLYTLMSFVLYFIAIGVMVLFTYVQPVVESIRTNRAYGDEEIVMDINAINIKIGEMEPELLQRPWTYDTVVVVKYKAPTQQHTYYDEDGLPYADSVAVPVTATPNRTFLDSATFNARRNYADSVVKINDSLFVLYHVPNYTFLSSGSADRFTKHKLLSSLEIYHTILKDRQTPSDKRRTASELSVLLRKYHYWKKSDYYYEDMPGTRDLHERIRKKYQLYNIEGSLYNITEKKYRWNRANAGAYIRLFYYFTLAITLLVLIFRQSTVRTFFLSLLTALLLTIFTALVFSFLNLESQAFFTWLIVYTLLFFLGSLSAWFIKKRKAITGIMINLFVFLIPALPIWVLAAWYNWKRQQYLKRNELPDLPNIEHIIWYAEIGGALLFLILLATYISRLYRRWYALPEE